MNVGQLRSFLTLFGENLCIIVGRSIIILGQSGHWIFLCAVWPLSDHISTRFEGVREDGCSELLQFILKLAVDLGAFLPKDPLELSRLEDFTNDSFPQVSILLQQPEERLLH